MSVYLESNALLCPFPLQPVNASSNPARFRDARCAVAFMLVLIHGNLITEAQDASYIDNKFASLHLHHCLRPSRSGEAVASRTSNDIDWLMGFGDVTTAG